MSLIIILETISLIVSIVSIVSNNLSTEVLLLVEKWKFPMFFHISTFLKVLVSVTRDKRDKRD